MMPEHLFKSLFALLLALSTTAVYAEDDRARELKRALEERDRVIIELLERVEALERRVGVEPSETDTSGSGRSREGVPAADDRVPTTEDAPGRIVVEEGAAERALERTLTLQGALLLPPGMLEIEPALLYARREDTTPGFVTTGGGVTASELQRSVNNLAADLSLRLGLPWDAQLELGIPYRWRRTETVTQVSFAPNGVTGESGHGWGDLRVGLAKTLLTEGRWRPDLIGRLSWNTDTGDMEAGNIALGDGFEQLRASFTAIKRQDPIAFVGGLSWEHVFENGQLRPGPTVAANFGGFIALSPETSLQVSFSGAYQDETEAAGQKIAGSDRTLGTLVLGGSTLLTPGVLLNLSLGVGLTEDADDFSLVLSLPIRL